MDELLTTRQVLDFLKVDRITVYRMLQDGRISGVKVGRQWRFPLQEVERILGGVQPSLEPSQAETMPGFPTHCVQTIQDLFAEVSQMSALVMDINGDLLTEVSRPCRFCQIIRQTQAGQQACLASWKDFAQANPDSIYFTCHAGIQYIRAPILDQDEQVGYFLAGEFYWRMPDPEEEAGRIQRLGNTLSLPVEILQQAAHTIPVITAQQQSQVQGWPLMAAQAIQSILNQRTMFMERLHQIANLTQMD
jgi:excisionase family DNA binding protein